MRPLSLPLKSLMQTDAHGGRVGGVIGTGIGSFPAS